jgi:hypothetical protein
LKKALTAVVVAAGLYTLLTFSSLKARQDSFSACNIQSTELADLFNRDLSVKPSVSNLHDQVDGFITICMEGHGYEYNAAGWNKCPNEKIAMCYKKPNLIEQIRAYF